MIIDLLQNLFVDKINEEDNTEKYYNNKFKKLSQNKNKYSNKSVLKEILFQR